MMVIILMVIILMVLVGSVLLIWYMYSLTHSLILLCTLTIACTNMSHKLQVLSQQ